MPKRIILPYATSAFTQHNTPTQLPIFTSSSIKPSKFTSSSSSFQPNFQETLGHQAESLDSAIPIGVPKSNLAPCVGAADLFDPVLPNKDRLHITNSHNMITRSKVGIYKPKVYIAVLQLEFVDENL